MNRTHFEHAIFALVIQALVAALAYGLIWIGWIGAEIRPAIWLIGAAAGIAFFVGREHDQNTYKLAKERHVSILVIPWYLPLRIWRWSLDSQLDLLFPVLVCLLLAVGIGLI